ncbi:hypothetical protein DL93DRAFT_2167993 [Clavulina sp. PMI_390]|nr:hypothetical protein DL93DRAFT_2167993 [Clavulina sp. PMI_390]
MLLLAGRQARHLSVRQGALLRPTVTAAPRQLSYSVSGSGQLGWNPNGETLGSSNLSTSSAALQATPHELDQTLSDASIFLEDVSDEYGYGDGAIERELLQNAILESVLKGDYATAETVREKMVDSDIPIPFHPSYSALALHILLSLAGRANHPPAFSTRPLAFQDFLNWWSLVAVNREDQTLPSDVLESIGRLLKDSNIPVSDARVGAVALASKACTAPLLSLTSRIVRFSLPSEIAPFLHALDVAEIESDAERRRVQAEPRGESSASSRIVSKRGIEFDSNTPANIRRHSARRWLLAIRTQAFSGRAKEAVQLLDHLFSTSPNLINHATILSCLQPLDVNGTGEALLAERVWHIARKSLWPAQVNSLTNKMKALPLPTKNNRLAAAIHGSQVQSMEHSIQNPQLEGEVPSDAAPQSLETPTLPTFEELMAISHEADLPSVETLALWMGTAREAGQNKEIASLRERWLHLGSRNHHMQVQGRFMPRSYAPQQLWAKAAMYLALSDQRPFRAITTFLSFYSLDGVPGRNLLENLANRLEVDQKQDFAGLGSSGFVEEWSLRPEQPLTPGPHAVTMLVNALLSTLNLEMSRSSLRQLHLTPVRVARELYADCIALLERTANSQKSDVSFPVESVPVQLLPDATLFHSFLTSPHLQGDSWFQTVLKDMRRFGVNPTRASWIVILKHFVTKGEDAVVLQLLGMMQPKQDTTTLKPSDVPTADAGTYVAVLSTALATKHWDLARAVATKLQEWEARLPPSDAYWSDESTRELLARLKLRAGGAQPAEEPSISRPHSRRSGRTSANPATTVRK